MESQADRARYCKALIGRGQMAGLLVTGEHDNGIGALIRDEEPASAGIEAEIARPVTARRYRLLQSGHARRLCHGEHCDRIRPAIRHVQ